MRQMLIVLVLSSFFANAASAEGPDHGLDPGTPFCDQSKAYPRAPSVQTPEIAGWRIAGSHSVRGCLFIEFERTIPSGWEKINVIVRRATDEEASNGDPAFENALSKVVRDHSSTFVGKASLRGDTLTVATKRKDGSRGAAAVRIVTRPDGTAFLVSAMGQWPSGRQAAFSKLVLTLIDGITVE